MKNECTEVRRLSFRIGHGLDLELSCSLLSDKGSLMWRFFFIYLLIIHIQEPHHQERSVLPWAPASYINHTYIQQTIQKQHVYNKFKVENNGWIQYVQFPCKGCYRVYYLNWSSKRKIKVFHKSQKSCFNDIRFKSLKYKKRDTCRIGKQCEWSLRAGYI